MIIYIIFIVVILLVNGGYLSKQIWYLCQNENEEEEMHAGEYSSINMDDDHERVDTKYDPNPNATLNTPFQVEANPFESAADKDKTNMEVLPGRNTDISPATGGL